MNDVRPEQVVALVGRLRAAGLLVTVADAVEVQRLFEHTAGATLEPRAHAVGHLVARDAAEHDLIVELVLGWARGALPLPRRPPPLGRVERAVGWALAVSAWLLLAPGWVLSHDGDGDGALWAEDCDDHDARVFAGAAETCDGRDDDCDGSVDEREVPLDADGDGSPGSTSVCPVWPGDAPDCEDADGEVHPGAAESCDGRDDDCDGLTDNAAPRYLDRDGDGFGTEAEAEACVGGVGWWADRGEDCDATDGSIYPGAVDAPGDGVDQDCDGCDGACAPPCARTLPAPTVQPPRTGWEQVLLLVMMAWLGLHHLWPARRLQAGTAPSAWDELRELPGPRSFSLGPHDIPGPVSDATVLATARALRQLDDAGPRLDVARTVEATAREQRPELRFQPQRGRARLLVLVDEAPRTRAWGPRLQGLLDGLADRGVELEVWRFVRAPFRFTRAPAPRPTPFSYLREAEGPVQAATLLQAAQGWWVTVVSAGEEDLRAGALWWPALVAAQACWLTPVEDPRRLPPALRASPVPVFDTTPEGLLRWARWLRTRDTSATRARRVVAGVKPEEVESLVWVAGLLPDGDRARAISVLRSVYAGTSTALYDAVRSLPLGLDTADGRARHRVATERLAEVGLLATLEPLVRRELEVRIAAAEPADRSSAGHLRWRLWRGWLRLSGDDEAGAQGQQELVDLARSPLRGEVGGWLERTSTGWPAGRVAPVHAALNTPVSRPPPWGRPSRWVAGGLAVAALLAGWLLPQPAPEEGVERVGYVWEPSAEGGARLTRVEPAAPERVQVWRDGAAAGEAAVAELRAGAVGCWEVSQERGGVVWRSEVYGAPVPRPFVTATVRAVQEDGREVRDGVALLMGSGRDAGLLSTPGLMRRVELGVPVQLAAEGWDVLVYAADRMGSESGWSPGERPELVVELALPLEGEGCVVFAPELGPYVIPRSSAGDPGYPLPTGHPLRQEVGTVVLASAWRDGTLTELPPARVQRGPGCTRVSWETAPAGCRVYVQYADASARPAAGRVQRALVGVCEVADGLDRKPTESWLVRYFYERDRADAERVWAVVKAQAGAVVRLEAATGFAQAPVGQIEVWVPAAPEPPKLPCTLALPPDPTQGEGRGALWASVMRSGGCGSVAIQSTDKEFRAPLVGYVQPAHALAAAELAVALRRDRRLDGQSGELRVVPLDQYQWPWDGLVVVLPAVDAPAKPELRFTQTLLSEPSEQRVVVDGDPRGRTPLQVELGLGEHTLRIGEVEQTVKVEREETWCGQAGGVVRGPCGPRLRIDTVSFGPASFVMGSPGDEVGREDDEGQHTVRVPRRFALATTEVSQGLYRAVMGGNPSYEGNGIGDELPVNQVSWLDAVKFCTKLSVSQGLRPAYTAPGEVDTWDDADAVRWDPEADGWRLPTEAEWELAARAAGKEMYGSTADPTRVCAFANVADEAAQKVRPKWEVFPCNDGFGGLAPVGSLAPQAGLHQMLGNVWEWAWDRYAEDITAEEVDRGGPSGGGRRVDRGGSFSVGPELVRVASRGSLDPSVRVDNVGFRLARSLPSAL